MTPVKIEVLALYYFSSRRGCRFVDLVLADAVARILVLADAVARILVLADAVARKG